MFSKSPTSDQHLVASYQIYLCLASCETAVAKLHFFTDIFMHQFDDQAFRLMNSMFRFYLLCSFVLAPHDSNVAFSLRARLLSVLSAFCLFSVMMCRYTTGRAKM